MRPSWYSRSAPARAAPCKHEGRSMREAHRGMGIGDADFDALVDDLVKTLKKFKVPACEQKELLGTLGPMRRDVVQPKVAIRWRVRTAAASAGEPCASARQPRCGRR